MENQIKARTFLNLGKLQKIIHPNTHSINTTKSASFERMEMDLNVKIMEVTMKIRYHYPELTKYLDKIPVTIPIGKDREITLNHLKEYYESLSLILDKYKLAFPKNS